MAKGRRLGEIGYNGIIWPRLAKTPENALTHLLIDLEQFYSDMRVGRGLEFVRAGNTYTSRDGHRTWPNKVVKIDGSDVFADVNIQYLEQIADDNPPPASTQQVFRIYFDVFGENVPMERYRHLMLGEKKRLYDGGLSQQERDSFYDYIERLR